MKYLFLLFPCFVFSQIVYNIDYLEKNNSGSYYKGQLFANDNESIYVKTDTIGVESKKIANNDFIIKDANEGMSEEVSISLPLSDEPTVYFNKRQKYFNFTTPKMYGKGRIIIRDSLPNIKWEITSESKEILNFQCQKAIGKYKCREYVVWFTKEIPLSIGPWHLNGLPGAILEAKAVDHYFEFIAISAEKVKDNSNSIKSKKNNFNDINETLSFNEYLDKLEEGSIALSKKIINNISENKIEGGKILSIKTTSSFETHDLCREKNKKQVIKEF